MNPNGKMSVKDAGDKIFEFRLILSPFGPKNYDPKYSHMDT